MSTKATLAHHSEPEDGKPSWHLYEEVFEAGVVYLQLEGGTGRFHDAWKPGTRARHRATAIADRNSKATRPAHHRTS